MKYIIKIALLFFLFVPKNSLSQIPLKKTQIIAHRGASGLAPENTTAAFSKAMEYHVDMIELDVHLSKDDSIIVMHDHNVERTTNGEGDIENLTYAEIKKLDAGSWFNEKYNNEHVPTLREVLQFVNGRTTVLIELKWPSEGIYKNLVKNVIQTIKECHAESWVIIQSFETKYLQEMHTLAPEIPCHQLIFAVSNALSFSQGRSMHIGEFKPLPHVKSVNISYKFLNKNFVQSMHEKGLTVFTYTVNSEKDMQRAIEMGVDGIITNRPDIAKHIL